MCIRDSDNSVEQYYVGAVVGRKTDNISNLYYLDSLAVTGGGTAKSETEMKAQGFPVQLGNAFAKDASGLNGGYPILAWQTAKNLSLIHIFKGIEVIREGSADCFACLSSFSLRSKYSLCALLSTSSLFKSAIFYLHLF